MRFREWPGRGLCRQGVVIVSLFGFVGCTSVQTIEPPYSSSLAGEVDPGSDVQITTKDHKTYRVHVIEVSEAGIKGTIENGDGRAYWFRYQTIESMKQKKIDATKTTLTVVGTTLAVLGVLYGILVYSFSHIGDN